MGGDAPRLESGERYRRKVERWCGGGCTGLAYLGITMMEKLNELVIMAWVSRHSNSRGV